jgi:hypothetical protein
MTPCVIRYPAMAIRSTLIERTFFTISSLVIGNGYEWRNGEMVDRFLKGKTLPEMISKTLAEQEKQRRATRLHGFNWMKEHGLPAPIFKDPVRPSPEQVEDLIKTPGKVKSFYPGSFDYSDLVRFDPAEIKSDWAAAVAEFAHVILDQDTSQHSITNREIAHRALDMLKGATFCA